MLHYVSSETKAPFVLKRKVFALESFSILAFLYHSRQRVSNKEDRNVYHTDDIIASLFLENLSTKFAGMAHLNV